MTPSIAIVGPTASGKTALAIELAIQLHSEIISADSMQVYKGMAIGTGAPTPEECARAKHHCVGFLEPSQQFSAGSFTELAAPILQRLQESGHIPIIAGGSGLYVQALLDGIFPGPAKDENIRQKLQLEAERLGVDTLYTKLQSIDPAYAQIIHPGDLRRIIRALEVYKLTGTPISECHRLHQASRQPIPALRIALDIPRPALYERINQRVDLMLENGFIDEVRALINAGHAHHISQLRTLGYPEFVAFLEERQSYAEAIEAMKRNTRRYAKRQLSWFRNNPDIIWLPAHQIPPAELARQVINLHAQLANRLNATT